jgi:hypothetical protein
MALTLCSGGIGGGGIVPVFILIMDSTQGSYSIGAATSPADLLEAPL